MTEESTAAATRAAASATARGAAGVPAASAAGVPAQPGGGREARDQVTVCMPAEGAYLSVLRTATAGLAARLDFTLDEIEDLRIAVDEARKATNTAREVPFSEVADFAMLREAQRELGPK